MRFALIKAGVVKAVVVCEPSFAAGYNGEYDQVVDVTGQPIGPDFTYDGNTFTPPNRPLPDPRAKAKRKLLRYIGEGNLPPLAAPAFSTWLQNAETMGILPEGARVDILGL